MNISITSWNIQLRHIYLSIQSYLSLYIRVGDIPDNISIHTPLGLFTSTSIYLVIHKKDSKIM